MASQLSTVPNISVEAEKDSYISITTTHYRYHHAYSNAIYRCINNNLDMFCLDEYLDQNDYDFFMKTLGIPRLIKGHARYTALVDNTRFPIPVVSRAVSLAAVINNRPDLLPLLRETDTYKIYFAICDTDDSDPIKQITKPLYNNSGMPMFVYSHDLVPFVFTRDLDEEDNLTDWDYNSVKSDEIKELIDEIFVYNSQLVMIEHNRKVNLIVKPVLSNGYHMVQANPLACRWRWTMNPRLRDHGIELVDDEYVLRRKVEGRYDPKDVFLLDPDRPVGSENPRYEAVEIDVTDNESGSEDEDEKPKKTKKKTVIRGVGIASGIDEAKFDYQNKFGCPYGVHMMYVYNGRGDPAYLVNLALDVLQDKLNLFQHEYSLDAASKIIHHREASAESRVYEKHLIIPYNTELKLTSYEDGKYSLLMDDTLLNMISLAALEIIDQVIQDDLDWWQQVNIFYNVPHRLIEQAQLRIQVPEDPAFTRMMYEYAVEETTDNHATNLLLAAINRCRAVLTDFKEAISGAIEEDE